MLDYKSIIIKRYALGLSYKELAEEFSASKSGINDFIRAFERCEKLSYPLPEGITNYAIYELVYGHEPGTNRRNDGYEQPDFPAVFKQMNERKNMTDARLPVEPLSERLYIKIRKTISVPSVLRTVRPLVQGEL